MQGLLAQELRARSGTRAAALEMAEARIAEAFSGRVSGVRIGEVRRRQNQVWWALLRSGSITVADWQQLVTLAARSPMFDKLLRRPSETLDSTSAAFWK